MNKPTNCEIGKITISRQIFELINRMPEHLSKDLWSVVMNYAFTGQAGKPDCQQSEIFFNAIRPFIDMDLEVSKQRRERLRQIALDRWKGKSKRSKKEKLQSSDKPGSKKFVPPTLEEVRAYIQEIDARISADCFFNFYQSNGWMIGRNKMKDWHSAVRSWQKREGEKQGSDAGRNVGKRTPWSAPVSAPEDFKDNWD